MLAAWPRRTQHEALLDLGWRKAFTEADRDGALVAAASWMAEELSLCAPPPSGQRSEAQVPDPSVIAIVQAFAEQAHEGVSVPGVAKWIALVAPAVGSGAKALANSLSAGLRSDRRDHRWLRAIGWVLGGGGAPAAWAYHHRSAEEVAVEIARAAAAPGLDAGDAMLLLSLLALWQRRRPTEQARGNKRHPSSRRAAPKAIATLAGSLIEAPQIQPLFGLCSLMAPDAGRALAILVVECALTEAHLAPHVDRRRQRATGHASSSGESWLLPVERWLEGPGRAVLADDRAVVAYRIAAMRGWRDRVTLAPLDAAAVRSPYVAASMALTRARAGQSGDLDPFSPSEPGLLMLAPLIRSARAKVTP